MKLNFQAGEAKDGSKRDRQTAIVMNTMRRTVAIIMSPYAHIRFMLT